MNTMHELGPLEPPFRLSCPPVSSHVEMKPIVDEPVDEGGFLSCPASMAAAFAIGFMACFAIASLFRFIP